MKCCICGKTIIGWGNNPWPVNNDEEARCCNECNMSEVIPARIFMMYDKMAKAGRAGVEVE